MRIVKLIVGFFLLGIFFVSCTTVPLTGRSQFNVIPNTTLLSMSLQQYDDFLQKNKVSKNQTQIRMVQTVGNRIRRAVEQYFSENNMSDKLAGYEWEFNLVESKDVNAWCMPGGKVVVYTGILPITRDENGLAVVMGHEVAHAIAEHGGERMSQGLAVQLGGMALSTALSEQPATTQKLFMGAFGLGAQYGFMLPYSRLHESEADRLGLIFMALAGYDPNHAVGFWQRMAQNSNKKSVPEFLSTHPSDETRIRDIQALIPEAMPYYRRSRWR